MNSVKYHYEVTIYWEGKICCILNLNCNYKEGYVDVSMDNWAQHALTKFNHTPPDKPQHAPHARNAPIDGCKVGQLHRPLSQYPTLDTKCTHQIQYISGMLLYYSEIDPCIKPAPNKNSSPKSAPTKDINIKSTLLLDYMSTYPKIIIQYHASNMVLISNTNVTYLVLPKSLICAAA